MSLTARYAGQLGVLGAGLVAAAVHPALAPATPARAVVSAPAAVASVEPARLAGPLRLAANVRIGARPPATARRGPLASARPVATGHRPASSPPSPHPASTVAHSRPRPHAAVATPRRATSGPTPRDALNRAIARIPTYRPGAVRWVISSAYGYWGTADWYRAVLYVDPRVPDRYLYDVAVHEWSHELSVLAYGGDVAAATDAMNRWFGGRGLTGAERAADCMSILQGAGWTHYTTCGSSAWRSGAARLLRGLPLTS